MNDEKREFFLKYLNFEKINEIIGQDTKKEIIRNLNDFLYYKSDRITWSRQDINKFFNMFINMNNTVIFCIYDEDIYWKKKDIERSLSKPELSDYYPDISTYTLLYDAKEIRKSKLKKFL